MYHPYNLWFFPTPKAYFAPSKLNDIYIQFGRNCVQIPEGKVINERELIKHEKDQLADCTWTAELFIHLIKGMSIYWQGMALKNKASQRFGDFSKERKEVEDLFLWKTPPGGLHAGQLYGRHRHHSQGVWGSLHPGEEYNGKIPPTALWTGLSFPFLSTIFFTYFQWQVWAADDYEIFKRMMIQKNIDLQMEALELLQQRFPLIPTSNPTQSSKSILLARIHSQSLKSILHSPEFQVWSPSWVPPAFKRVSYSSSGGGGQGDAGGDKVGATDYSHF